MSERVREGSACGSGFLPPVNQSTDLHVRALEHTHTHLQAHTPGPRAQAQARMHMHAHALKRGTQTGAHAPAALTPSSWAAPLSSGWPCAAPGSSPPRTGRHAAHTSIRREHASVRVCEGVSSTQHNSCFGKRTRQEEGHGRASAQQRALKSCLGSVLHTPGGGQGRVPA